MLMQQRIPFHHDRRHKKLGNGRHCGLFTRCRIHCLRNRIAMMTIMPILCAIICISISNSKRSIDRVILWQSQMLLRSSTIYPPISSSMSSTSQSTTTQPHTGDFDKRRLRLRYNYTSLQRYSPLANKIALIQSNQKCTTKSMTGYFWYRNRYGLGSDLHVYSVAICNVLQMKYYCNNNNSTTISVHVQSLLPWIWYDTERCQHRNASPHSAMTCYFPEAEPNCPAQQNFHHPTLNLTRKHGKIKEACSDVIQTYGGITSIRTATTEFLFTRISALVQEEGERQLNQVFRTTFVPHNLITVHIRWGDKADEMELIPITKYIDAVYEILEQRRRNRIDNTTGVHIFLSTEDPEALRQFQAAVPIDWNIYIDQYHIELLPHRRESNVYNGIPQMARELSGRPGLIALGSLLVAMEANDFILTTSSNWSRLMNEIRISIINPRCNNCTAMIDLNPGEW